MWIPKGAALIWDPALIRGNMVSTLGVSRCDSNLLAGKVVHALDGIIHIIEGTIIVVQDF